MAVIYPTPAQIADGSKCFCLTGSRAQQAIIYLLKQILVAEGGANMTPAQIAEASRCYCFTGDRFEEAAIYLLNQIAGNGGAGGGGLAFSTGTGSPEGVVSGSPGDTYWDTSTGFKWTKVSGTATTTGWLT